MEKDIIRGGNKEEQSGGVNTNPDKIPHGSDQPAEEVKEEKHQDLIGGQDKAKAEEESAALANKEASIKKQELEHKVEPTQSVASNKALEDRQIQREIWQKEYENPRYTESGKAIIKKYIQNIDNEISDLKLPHIVRHKDEQTRDSSTVESSNTAVKENIVLPTKKPDQKVFKKGTYTESNEIVKIPTGDESSNKLPETKSTEKASDPEVDHKISPIQEELGNLSDKDKVIEKLQQKIIDLENINAELDTENAEIKKKLETLEEKYNQAQGQIEVLNQKMDELSKKFEKLLSKNTPEKITGKKLDEQPISKPQPEVVEKSVEKEEEIQNKEDSAEDAWDKLSKEEKEALIKSYPGKAEYTRSKGLSDPKKVERVTYKVAKDGEEWIPTFLPKKFFRTPTVEELSSNTRYKGMSEGASKKGQWLHSTYRDSYGRKPLRGETPRLTLDTTEMVKDSETGKEIKKTKLGTLSELQNYEKIILADYYNQLIESAEKAGIIDDLSTDELIRDTMVDAKRDLENYLIDEYGKKVYQERRSNIGLRFVNFLNSDIAERKAFGDAMDILAMEGGSEVNAIAAIENMDQASIIRYMNAHVRRAIKQSLLKDGFYSPDDDRYDRHKTYTFLQNQYCRNMAKAAKQATANRNINATIRVGITREQLLNVDAEVMVNKIVKIQKERLMTLEENVSAKRWRDAWNKLKAAAIGGIIGGAILAMALNAHPKETQGKVYEVKSRTPKIEKVDDTNVEKDNQPTTPEIEDEDKNPQPPEPKPDSKIVEVQIGDKDVTSLAFDPDEGELTEIGSSNTAEALNNMQAHLANIETNNLDRKTPPTDEIKPGGVNNSFITSLEQSRGDQVGSVRMGNLEGAMAEWNKLDQVARDRFNALVMNDKTHPMYRKVLTEAGFPNDFYGWAQYELKKIQDNLGIEDVE